MRRLSLVLGMCICFCWAGANPISLKKAQNLALEYLNETSLQTRNGGATDLELAWVCRAGDRLDDADNRVARAAGKVADEASAPLYYVFNKGVAQGFVVIAGDDAVEPVLAVTNEGSFVLEEVHPNLRWWLRMMQNRLQEVALQSEVVMNRTADVDAGLKPAVEPLLKTQWGQGEPYNDLCPMDVEHGNVKSLSGCVATAMAQILNYWKYPKVVNKQCDYTTWTHQVHMADDLSKYPLKYDLMCNRYTGDESAEEKRAVAELMYVCGMVNRMGYCALVSGTYTSATAYHEVGMNAVIKMAEYCDVDEWTRTMKRELNEGRPIAMGGVGAEGGHAFVCDGYDRDELFHINWGWNGKYDGYYNLKMLSIERDNPLYPTLSFNNMVECLLGIEPLKEGEKPIPGEVLYSTKEMLQLDYDQVKIKVYDVMAYNNALNGDMRMEVATEQGEHVGWLTNPYRVDIEGPNYELGIIETLDTLMVGAWPSEAKDGRYLLRLCFKADGEEQYTEMSHWRTLMVNEAMLVGVKGKELKLLTEPREVKLTYRDVKVSQAIMDCPVSLDFTLKNEGDEYQGNLYFGYCEKRSEMKVVWNGLVKLGRNEEARVHLACKLPEQLADSVLLVYVDSTLSTNMLLMEVPLEIEVNPLPVLEAMEMVCLNEKELTTTDELKFRMLLKNKGCDGDAKMNAYLTHIETHQDVALTKIPVMWIKHKETKEVEFSLKADFPIPMGQYVAEVYYKLPDQEFLKYVTGSQLALELQEPTGVEQVVVTTEVPEDAVIYTLLGIRVLQPWKTLPRGIYVVNGQKMIKR